MIKKVTITITLVLVSCTSQLQNAPPKTLLPSGNDTTPIFTSTLAPMSDIGASNTIIPKEAISIPENTMIAYVGDQSVNVISAIGGDSILIVENYEATYYSSPSWSPSGDQIIFGSFGRDINPKISIINRDGSGLRLLSNNVYTDPSWSPNGERIAYVTSDGLYIVNSNGQGLQQLAGAESPVSLFATWSPNGKQLALLGDAGGPKRPYKIFIINSDGSNLHPVTDAIVGRSHLTWSPDGRKIAFRSFEGCGDINVLDLNTDVITNLTNTPGVVEINPAWSADGKYIAFSRSFDTPCNQDQVEGGQGNSIYIMKADGQAITLLTNAKGDQPSWWPTVILQPNWKYSVTKAGSNLNIRESPSISANSLTKLQHGAVFTVLDGPVDAGGYLWWQVRTSDGIEGWCVDVPGWYMFENSS